MKANVPCEKTDENKDNNPWQTFAGVWKGHPEFDEFIASIADYRRNVDQRDSAS